jgi:hypothetical protein
LKKAITILLWLSVFVIICLCAVYALIGNPERHVQNEIMLDGLSYTGTLLDGKLHGSGKILFANGDSFQGGFINGRFDGAGIFTSADGWRFEGNFSTGKMSEDGALFGADGEKLIINRIESDQTENR